MSASVVEAGFLFADGTSLFVEPRDTGTTVLQSSFVGMMMTMYPLSAHLICTI